MFKPPAHLVLRYQEPHRFYHGMGHIEELLSLIQTIPCSSDEKHILEVIAWYHDAVYEMNREPGWNEKESARLFEQDWNIHHVSLDLGRNMILATAKHLEDQEGLDFLTQCFLDVDLAGLGTADGTFERHADLVLQEYTQAGHAKEDVLKGRSGFYEKMLRRKQVYYTPFFACRETQARENMQNALGMPCKPSPFSF